MAGDRVEEICSRKKRHSTQNPRRASRRVSDRGVVSCPERRNAPSGANAGGRVCEKANKGGRRVGLVCVSPAAAAVARVSLPAHAHAIVPR
jgi:hypothetical protein